MPSFLGVDLRGHLDLMLLATLRDVGPAHGYAVIASLRERSLGAFDLPEGTVYPALHRLERDGLIDSQWDARASRRRRVYHDRGPSLQDGAELEKDDAVVDLRSPMKRVDVMVDLAVIAASIGVAIVIHRPVVHCSYRSRAPTRMHYNGLSDDPPARHSG